MAARKEENCWYWGLDREVWGYAVLIDGVAFLVFFGFASSNSSLSPLFGLCAFLTGGAFPVTLWAWGMAQWLNWHEDERVKEEEKRENQEREERERRQLRPARPVSPAPAPPPSPPPDPYRQAEVDLKARMEHAKKMQALHALRQQVEEEERKAGIFAPTLPPPQAGPCAAPPADPLAADMAWLARRRQEAERQSHLMKSLRTVEDAEWQADDI